MTVQDTFRIGEAYHVEPSLNRVTGPNGGTRLEPKVMLVLVCLADRAGQMVPKDRLLHAAWPDTAVGDDVLTRAISELRRLFDDDPKQPRVIETIPKAGYRLIAPVARPQVPESVPRATAAPAARGNRVMIAAVSSAIVIAVTAGWFLWTRSEVKTPALPQLVPLTLLRGLETSPTFSPDGTQIAFSWNGEHEDNFDIYVKFVGSSEVRRVTTDAGPDVSPAWSPDGQHIAFVRARPALEGGATIQLVSPLGGADRKLSDFRVTAYGSDSTPLAWSPDGRWVAASREETHADAGISLIPVSGGTSRAVTHAKAPGWHSGVAFSPDGHRLAYASCSNANSDNLPVCDVYAVDLGADYVPVAPSRRLTSQGVAIHGLAWSRDGSSIVYDTAGRGPYYLWRVMADGTHQPERIDVAGLGSRRPATVLSRDRLAFERRLPTLGVYRVSPGHMPEPVLVSPVFDFEPDFSPDGQRLAFSSRRSGDAVEIWLASADGSNAQQLTHGPGPRQGAPAWSPDGRRIAFESMREDGHVDIWVMDSDGSALRQLTTDPGDENAPTWSRDGRRIYFSSDRGGGRDIWWVPAGGGALTRVTHGGSGLVARETSDGNAIVYQTATGDSPLVMLPLTGGPARQLADCVKSQGYIPGKALAGDAAGIYYGQCGTGPESAIHLIDPVTGRDREVGRVSDPFFLSGLAVSPDGNTILVHRGTETADLVLIENFR